jgi:PAS domain-containing protein
MPKTMAAWSRSLATGQKFMLEYRLLGADGSYRWHRAEGEPVRNENGEVVKWFGIVIDIQREKSSLLSTAAA